MVGKTPDILTEVAFGKANVLAAVLAAPSVNPEKSTEVTVTFEAVSYTHLTLPTNREV